MILVKINKETVAQLNDEVCAESLIFFPDEYFECESTDIKNVFNLKNSRLERTVDCGFLNKYTTISSIDENIIDSDVLISGKIVKKFFNKFSGIRYIVSDIEGRRTKVLNDDSYYVLTDKTFYGLIVNEVKRNVQINETFSDFEPGKIFSYTSEKFNTLRENKKGSDSFDLGVDLFLNTFIDYSKQLSRYTREKGKDLLHNIPNYKEIQKKSEECFDKLGDDISRSINDVKNKVDNSLSIEPLTLDEIVKDLGVSIWYEVVKDIEKIAIKGTSGWGVVQLKDGKLQLSAKDFELDLLTNFESIKIYRNEVSKVINDIYNNTDDSPIKKQVDFVKGEIDKILNSPKTEDFNLNKETNIEECELPPVDLDAITLLSQRCNVGLKEAKDALEKSNYILEDAEKYLETKNQD